MGRKIQLIEDRTGTIHFDLPDAVPASATVTIRTANGGALPADVTDASAYVVASAVATVTSWVSTAPRTLTTGAGKRITTRRHYLLRRPDAQQEWVRVVADRATEIDLADRTSFDPDTGDEIYDCRVSYDLGATQTATRALNYRAEWTITDDTGEIHVVESLFDVVRSTPKRHANAAALRQYSPELCNQWEQLVGGYHGWEERLAAAFDRVLDDLEGHGDWSGAIVDWSQGERATYERLFITMADGGYIPAGDHWPGDTWIHRCEERYRTAFDAWMRNIRWYDEDDDRIVGSGEESANRSSLILEF